VCTTIVYNHDTQQCTHDTHLDIQARGGDDRVRGRRMTRM